MFKTYFIDVLIHHYADFKGTATRKQFWMWFLCCFIITFAVSFVLNFIAGFCIGLQLPSAPKIREIIGVINNGFSMIFSLVILLPYWAITARRFRDAGVSVMWFVILTFFNILGLLVMFVGVFMMMLTDLLVNQVVAGPSILGLVFLGAICVVFITSILLLIICSLPTKQTQLN